MIRPSLRFAIILITCLIAPVLHAQNWQRVLQVNSNIVSSGFFYNTNLGWVGTGRYQASTPIEIYRTTDGGNTWSQSYLPALNLAGQVNDIFFSTATDGWACIREAQETGWSGVYHSTDAGATWKFVHQAGFPAAIRVNSRGVFYTDRDQDPGVEFSSDGGLTWKLVASTAAALSIDFMDDKTAFVTTQAVGGSHLITTDGGLTWTGVNTRSECWTCFGDQRSKSFLLACEHDNSGINAVFKTPVLNPLETSLITYGANGLTGGIAGYRGCTSVIYAQRRAAPGGLIRTQDGGANWTPVGGPSNKVDTRFAVTGRGAVVFAFDSIGGVWRSMNGGDGKLSASVLNQTSLISEDAQTRASVCDSMPLNIDLRYIGCDSVRITNIIFPDDQWNELSFQPTRQAIAGGSSGVLRVVFRPTHIHLWSTRARISIAQPDGYTEDTTITLFLNGLARSTPPLSYKGTNAQHTLSFDTISVCTGGQHDFTILNSTCFDVKLFSIQLAAPFSLVSQFQSFTLSAGDERTFELTYSPSLAKSDNTMIYVRTDAGLDSIPISGTAINPSSALPFAISPISASNCDSSVFTITYRNIQCSTIRLTGIQILGSNIKVLSSNSDSIGIGASQTMQLLYKPQKSGATLDSVRLHFVTTKGTTIDTTLLLQGVASAGVATITPSSTLIDFGNVSACGSADDTLFLRAVGCGVASASVDIDTSIQHFSILRPSNSTIAAGTTDTVILHFASRIPGSYVGRMLLATSTGKLGISLRANSINDAGSIQLNVSPDDHSSTNIRSLTCSSSGFTTDVINGTCDYVYLDSVSVAGANASDFIVGTIPQTKLASGDVYHVSGKFIPQLPQIRNAMLVLHFHRHDGTTVSDSVALAGIGLPVPPIPVAIGNLKYIGKVGSTIEIPIYALGTGQTKARSFDFTVKLNTNLLSPINGASSGGALKNASITRFDASNDSVNVSLSLPADVDITPGELWRLRCMAYVTDTLHTVATLARSRFSDANNSAACLPTTSELDSTAQFTLDAICGDRSISHTMAGQRIQIESISPNPSTGYVTVTFRTNRYDNQAQLEVFNALGIKLSSTPVVLNSSSNIATLYLNIQGAAGVHYLRLVSSDGIATRSIELLK